MRGFREGWSGESLRILDTGASSSWFCSWQIARVSECQPLESEGQPLQAAQSDCHQLGGQPPQLQAAQSDCHQLGGQQPQLQAAQSDCHQLGGQPPQLSQLQAEASTDWWAFCRRCPSCTRRSSPGSCLLPGLEEWPNCLKCSWFFLQASNAISRALPSLSGGPATLRQRPLPLSRVAALHPVSLKMASRSSFIKVPSTGSGERKQRRGSGGGAAMAGRQADLDASHLAPQQVSSSTQTLHKEAHTHTEVQTHRHTDTHTEKIFDIISWICLFLLKNWHIDIYRGSNICFLDWICMFLLKKLAH